MIFFALALGLILAPYLSNNQAQGRYFQAPPSYVRQKLFDPGFINPILEQTARSDFFYPLRLREQGEQSHSGKQPDHDYAKTLTDTHASFGSDVQIAGDSVAHITLQDGSAWQGQRMLHTFTFSEVEGANGSSAVFEYEREWQGSALLNELHSWELLSGLFGEGNVGMIDAECLDVFWKAVEKAWSEESGAQLMEAQTTELD